MSDNWVKPHDGFVVRDVSLEPPFGRQRGFLTPNETFFVCNTTATPRIDARTYRLNIDGDGVERSVTLSYDDLRAMPQRDLTAYIECAGNHRALFDKVMGKKLDQRAGVTEVLWELGAVGLAKWRGVALRDVLALAGVREDAIFVCPKGLDVTSDEGGEMCPIPVAKALDENTLLALEMNDEVLPADHGFPARVVVPGWVGTYSIKWVGAINVVTKPVWVARNTRMYVMMGEHWNPDDYAPALGPPVYEQSLKSSLALDWPAQLAPGLNTLYGYARSPDASIANVEWSDDDGKTWRPATLFGPNEKYTWTQFKFDWQATLGKHAIATRACDTKGRKQPDTLRFNTGGYLFNLPHPHPVIVEDNSD